MFLNTEVKSYHQGRGISWSVKDHLQEGESHHRCEVTAHALGRILTFQTQIHPGQSSSSAVVFQIADIDLGFLGKEHTADGRQLAV